MQVGDSGVEDQLFPSLALGYGDIVMAGRQAAAVSKPLKEILITGHTVYDLSGKCPLMYYAESEQALSTLRCRGQAGTTNRIEIAGV